MKTLRRKRCLFVVVCIGPMITYCWTGTEDGKVFSVTWRGSLN